MHQIRFLASVRRVYMSICLFVRFCLRWSFTLIARVNGANENAGVVNAIRSKKQGWKMQ